MNAPLIAVIATGGTIASRKGGDGATAPALTGEDLLAMLPPLPVRLRAVELLAKDSSALTLAEIQAISDAVAVQLGDPDVSGVVVLHGTDSMEETALLVQVQQDLRRPVIFTGAQFASDHVQADGRANLAAAISDAIRVENAGQVLLRFGPRLLPAWGLYKAASDQADAFALAASAPGGSVARLPAPIGGMRVDIVALYPGCDATHLLASVAAGAQGIVLAALGSGNTNAIVVAAVADCTARGIPVIVSSRVPQGQLAPAYGGGGGGHDLALAGALHSRILRPPQARILLAALLASGVGRAGQAAAFA